MILHSGGVEDTRRIGARLAEQLRAGDVVLMLGDMGAGKSELTRGIARGLGVTGYVTSPTFTILQVHESGRLPLYHSTGTGFLARRSYTSYPWMNTFMEMGFRSLNGPAAPRRPSPRLIFGLR